jgi:hypothetical protein
MWTLHIISSTTRNYLVKATGVLHAHVRAHAICLIANVSWTYHSPTTTIVPSSYLEVDLVLHASRFYFWSVYCGAIVTPLHEQA